MLSRAHVSELFKDFLEVGKRLKVMNVPVDLQLQELKENLINCAVRPTFYHSDGRRYDIENKTVKLNTICLVDPP